MGIMDTVMSAGFISFLGFNNLDRKGPGTTTRTTTTTTTVTEEPEELRRIGTYDGILQQMAFM